MNTEMVVAPAFFGTAAFIIWVVVNSWQRRQQLKLITEFGGRLLDRLGSAKDFNELLQTDGGAKLIGAMSAAGGSTGARDRIMGSTQMGVVFVALGCGVLFLDSRFTFDDEEAFTIIGVLALSLGVGLLLSSGVSCWLARQLGVLETKDSHSDARPPAQ